MTTGTVHPPRQNPPPWMPEMGLAQSSAIPAERQELSIEEYAGLLPLIFQDKNLYGPKQIADLVGLDKEDINRFGYEKKISCVFTPDNRVLGGKMWLGKAIANWLLHLGRPLKIRESDIFRAKGIIQAKQDQENAAWEKSCDAQMVRIQAVRTYKNAAVSFPALVKVLDVFVQMAKHGHSADDVLRLIEQPIPEPLTRPVKPTVEPQAAAATQTESPAREVPAEPQAAAAKRKK